MKLYTASELAEVLKVHPKTIYSLGRQGKLKSLRVGKSVRFVMPEIGEDYANTETEEQRPI